MNGVVISHWTDAFTTIEQLCGDYNLIFEIKDIGNLDWIVKTKLILANSLVMFNRVGFLVKIDERFNGDSESSFADFQNKLNSTMNSIVSLGVNMVVFRIPLHLNNRNFLFLLNSYLNKYFLQIFIYLQSEFSASNSKIYDSDFIWNYWNRMQTFCQFHQRLKIIFDCTCEISLKVRESTQKKWLCEPISALILPVDFFDANYQLKEAHKEFILPFLRLKPRIYLKNFINFRKNDFESLKKYCKHLNNLRLEHVPRLINSSQNSMSKFNNLLIQKEHLHETLFFHDFNNTASNYYEKALRQTIVEQLFDKKVVQILLMRNFSMAMIRFVYEKLQAQKYKTEN